MGVTTPANLLWHFCPLARTRMKMQVLCRHCQINTINDDTSTPSTEGQAVSDLVGGELINRIRAAVIPQGPEGKIETIIAAIIVIDSNTETV